MVTLDDLVAICPHTRRARLAEFLDPLVDALHEFDINTRAREAAFLAQVCHESGCFIYTRELWGPTEAQQRYEGREDLGNTHRGDGFRFRGRGLLQVTGRAGYAALTRALGVNLLNNPDLLEYPVLAARSAAYWWKEHGCNELADAGDFEALTRRINGGVNGLDERTALWEVAKETLAA